MSRGAKNQKKISPYGEIWFSLWSFRFLGFDLLKDGGFASFLGDFDEVRIVSFLILIHIETIRF